MPKKVLAVAKCGYNCSGEKKIPILGFFHEESRSN